MMFDTGDRARWTPHGELEHLGRDRVGQHDRARAADVRAAPAHVVFAVAVQEHLGGVEQRAGAQVERGAGCVRCGRAGLGGGARRGLDCQDVFHGQRVSNLGAVCLLANWR